MSTSTTAAHREGAFPGVGGVSIFWQAWLPPDPAAAWW